jgi:hypothetical protein
MDTNETTPKWAPGQPLPKWAGKATMSAIATWHGEPISPDGLKFHPLKVTKPGRANLFDVSYALKYFESRIKQAGVHRVGFTRRRDSRADLSDATSKAADVQSKSSAAR